MDYEFLEDIYVNWHQSGEDDISITSKGNTLKESETNSTFGPDDQNQEYESIDNKTTEEIERQLEKKNSHPLMLMVQTFFINGDFCMKTRLVCFFVSQHLFPTTKLT